MNHSIRNCERLTCKLTPELLAAIADESVLSENIDVGEVAEDVKDKLYPVIGMSQSVKSMASQNMFFYLIIGTMAGTGLFLFLRKRSSGNETHIA